MEHKGTKTIETESLILRPFREDDAPAGYKNWCSDSRVTEFLTWPPHESVEVTREIFKSWENSGSDPEFYQWAIVPKNVGEPVGSISVVDINKAAESMSIGYCIGFDYWHKGITGEALAAVIDYLFGEVGALRIEARHDPMNPHSGAVMKKCGMVYEGTLRASAKSNRGISDMCIYSILKNEWKGQQKTL